MRKIFDALFLIGVGVWLGSKLVINVDYNGSSPYNIIPWVGILMLIPSLIWDWKDILHKEPKE